LPKKKRKKRWITRTEMLGAGIDEVNEASATIELGEEDGGVGLGLGGFDPLKAGSDGTTVAAAFAEDSAAITTHPHDSVSCLASEKCVGKCECLEESEGRIGWDLCGILGRMGGDEEAFL
jgi:hypothetical protein